MGFMMAMMSKNNHFIKVERVPMESGEVEKRR